MSGWVGKKREGENEYVHIGYTRIRMPLARTVAASPIVTPRSFFSASFDFFFFLKISGRGFFKYFVW